jgi:hypothetical protein
MMWFLGTLRTFLGRAEATSGSHTTVGLTILMIRRIGRGRSIETSKAATYLA